MKSVTYIVGGFVVFMLLYEFWFFNIASNL